MSHPDDYTADDVDAITFGGDATASWDNDTNANTNDLFFLSANLRTNPLAASTAAPSAVAPPLSASSAGLFQNYTLQGIEQSQRQQQRYHQQQQQQQPQRTADPSDEIASLLSRIEAQSFNTLNDIDDEYDSRALRLVEDLAFDDEDEEEVAAAKSAVGAGWIEEIPQQQQHHAYQQGTPAKPPQQQQLAHQLASMIPPPGSQPLPTPTKVMSLADLEKQLRGGSVPPATPQSSPVKDSTPSTPNSTYSGPPLPQFQHGAPAPQGLSIDENERQHFYIPLPRNSNNLGLMTKSEIALVFRIQLSQLQSIGDPLSDDFYYQVIQARKGGKVNASGQVILPVFRNGSNIGRNEDGSPKLPEGTLGRISAFSIHKPKKLMAIGDASSSSDSVEVADDQPRKTNMFSSRTLNFLIEEGYRGLMDLEDVDALLASLAPRQFEDPTRAFDRQRLMTQRVELCTRLVEALDLDEIHLRMNEVTEGEHLIFKFYAVPKGRLLIYRALVLLNPPLTYQLVDVLMHDLLQISMPTTPAPSTDEKLTLLISDLIYSMPLLPYANEIFSYFLQGRHATRLIELIRTSMLCNFLQVFFKKGHEANMILQQNPHIQSVPGMPGIRETVQQWRTIFDGITELVKGRVADIFEGLPKDVKPTLPPTASQLAAKQRREKEEKKAAASGASAAGDKKVAEEKKSADVKGTSSSSSTTATPAAPVHTYLSTRFGMWELMAAFFSHANADQRVWLNAELREVVIKEAENLYGEYRERKEKQVAAAAAAAMQSLTDKSEDKSVAPADATAAASSDDKDKEKEKEKSSAPATEAKKDEPQSYAAVATPRRPVTAVPPASSLPPPPSPALRFLTSALLGDTSPEYLAIARVWNDLHSDYSFYQMKHQQKVQQEQARLQQQQQLRAQRQGQQRQQWQQYQGSQQRGGGGGPSSSPHRVPHQHQHFHSQHGGQSNRTPQRGPRPHGTHASPQQRPAQAPYVPDQPIGGPAKPVPVWVKAGTSGANAMKTPVKQPAPTTPAKQ